MAIGSTIASASKLIEGVLVCILITGCAFTTGVDDRRRYLDDERRCAPTDGDLALRRVSLTDIDTADDRVARMAEARAPNSFSWRAMQAAHAIEILPLLSRIEVLEERRGTALANQTQLNTVRNEVLGRIMLAMSEVSSTAGKAACEIERTYQAADRLRAGEQARVKQQTLWAIIIGAAAAMAAGGATLSDAGSPAEGLASLIGGLVAGALGVTALYQEGEETFTHSNNILSEVWLHPDQPRYIPPSIWLLLKQPVAEGSESKSYLEELMASWRQEGRLGTPGSKIEQKRRDLFFGSGGSYTTSDLVARAQMLDMLRATILIMNQHMERLIREVMIQTAVRKQSWSPTPKNP
ncbi:hypothetical protein [Nitrospira sp. BLG_2]|uniref:hypothetical protein n=1 Tax=Nitrospira sp. BLG_2 TaxID=3397507 RepID=UPI003B9B8918